GPAKPLHLAMENFYGPGDDASKLVESLSRQMLAGAARIALTKGEQRRDFLFIDDAVSACLTCLDRAAEIPAHQIVPVGSGESISIRELAEMLRRLAGAKTVLDFGALAY